MRHFVGIDLGTSAVKVLVLREDGRVVAKRSVSYPLEHPAPGYTEQSVEAWWSALGEATRGALAASGPAEVAAVALSGQLNALVMLDEQQRPLENAWIWLDLRAAELAKELERQHGADFRRAVENPANPIYVGVKLAWLARERPSCAPGSATCSSPRTSSTCGSPASSPPTTPTPPAPSSTRCGTATGTTPSSPRAHLARRAAAPPRLGRRHRPGQRRGRPRHRAAGRNPRRGRRR
jgi:hypothetical protein